MESQVIFDRRNEKHTQIQRLLLLSVNLGTDSAMSPLWDRARKDGTRKGTLAASRPSGGRQRCDADNVPPGDARAAAGTAGEPRKGQVRADEPQVTIAAHHEPGHVVLTLAWGWRSRAGQERTVVRRSSPRVRRRLHRASPYEDGITMYFKAKAEVGDVVIDLTEYEARLWVMRHNGEQRSTDGFGEQIVTEQTP
jgi:hypothetical protein